MATEKLAYNAKNVIIRDEGAIVHAFWAADPEVARQLADRTTPNEVVNRLWGRDDVELVAVATRYYKTLDGTDFSGWVVASSNGQDYSDPIRTKRDARRSLRGYIAEYFTNRRACGI